MKTIEERIIELERSNRVLWAYHALTNSWVEQHPEYKEAAEKLGIEFIRRAEIEFAEYLREV